MHMDLCTHLLVITGKSRLPASRLYFIGPYPLLVDRTLNFLRWRLPPLVILLMTFFPKAGLLNQSMFYPNLILV